MIGIGRNLNSKLVAWRRKSPFPCLSLNFILSEENSMAQPDHPYTGVLLLWKWPSKDLRRRRPAVKQSPSSLGGMRPVTAAASSWGPRAAPSAGQESDAPPAPSPVTWTPRRTPWAVVSSGSDSRGFLKMRRSGSSAANRASTGHRGEVPTRSPVAMAAGVPPSYRKQFPPPRSSQSAPKARASHEPITLGSLWKRSSKKGRGSRPRASGWGWGVKGGRQGREEQRRSK